MRSHGNRPTYNTKCPLCHDDLGDPISDTYLYCPTSMRDEDGCPETDEPSGETPPVASGKEWVASCKTEPLIERLGTLDKDTTLALMCGHRTHALCLKNTLIEFANKCPICKAKIAACSQIGQVTESSAFDAARTEEDRALALEMQFDENLAAQHQRRAAAAALASASIEFEGTEYRDHASVNATIATFLAGLVVGTSASRRMIGRRRSTSRTREEAQYDDDRPMSEYGTDIEKFAALMRAIGRSQSRDRANRLRLDPTNRLAIREFVYGSIYATVEPDDFEDLMKFFEARGVVFANSAWFCQAACYRAGDFLETLADRPNVTRSQMTANASFLQHTLAAVMETRLFSGDVEFTVPESLRYTVELEYARIIPKLTIDSLSDTPELSHGPQSGCVWLVYNFRDGLHIADEDSYLDIDSDTQQCVSFLTTVAKRQPDGDRLLRKRQRFGEPVRWRWVMNARTVLSLNYWLSDRLPHMPEEELVSLVEAIRDSDLSFARGEGIDEVARQLLVFKISKSARARAIDLPFVMHSGGAGTGTMAAVLPAVLAAGLTIVLATVRH